MLTQAEMERVERSIFRSASGCWIWMSYEDGQGYGLVSVGRRLYKAHRVVYELYNGDIPAGLTIDHLCRVRICVNPEHMEPVTHEENTLRGISEPAQNARKTHCKWGHPFDAANTRMERRRRGGVDRVCRACRACDSAAKRQRAAFAPRTQGAPR